MKVYVVEHRTWPYTDSCVAYIASSLEKALAFIKENPDWDNTTETHDWFWWLGLAEVDGQSLEIENLGHVSQDGIIFEDLYELLAHQKEIRSREASIKEKASRK